MAKIKIILHIKIILVFIQYWPTITPRSDNPSSHHLFSNRISLLFILSNSFFSYRNVVTKHTVTKTCSIVNPSFFLFSSKKHTFIHTIQRTCADEMFADVCVFVLSIPLSFVPYRVSGGGRRITSQNDFIPFHNFQVLFPLCMCVCGCMSQFVTLGCCRFFFLFFFCGATTIGIFS